MTGIYLAIYFGLAEEITTLLKNSYDLDSKDSDGRTLLLWAAGNGHEAVVKLLLEKGAQGGGETTAGKKRKILQ
jgi:ankyrin repeat protein